MAETHINTEPESYDGPRMFDISNTHDDNRTLFEREDVRKFYKMMDDATDPGATNLTEKFIEWLGSIPHTMSNTAIPLFPERSGGVDYQVHPCYSELEEQLPRDVDRPHFYVSSMMVDDQRVLVIPFGRLFVNAPDDENQTGLSKWTGYEVLLDINRNLWFIFDRRSLSYRWSGWYPVRCNLGELNTAESRSDGPPTVQLMHTIIETPTFQSAHVSLIGRKLSTIRFDELQEKIHGTMEEHGEVLICEVSEQEVEAQLSSL
ncbi:hypothetical protein GGR51DRAFT_560705 [Nemania sp. FL0031]|nr:hypothetical protein GGR51DRAFT_560705 [Nemania sp. FL0031]